MFKKLDRRSNRKLSSTRFSLEHLETRTALSATSMVNPVVGEKNQAIVANVQASQVQAFRVAPVQTNPALRTPSSISVIRGAGSLGNIMVTGSERVIPAIMISTGRGGTITSNVSDPRVGTFVRGNSAGGTDFFMWGRPADITRNLKNLTYRGSESSVRVLLYTCQNGHCTWHANVTVPLRHFR